MNFVFLSPHFPPNYYRFAVALKNHGVTVLGLGDESYDALRPELKSSMTEYFRVRDMNNYEELLRAGVKIHERQGVLLHSKTALVDGVWATVGSTNLDWRSFLHNLEVNAVVLGGDFGRQLQALFARDLAESSEVTLDAWRARGLRLRLKEALSKAWEYWL